MQCSAVQWPVRILMECILVFLDVQLYYCDNRSQVTNLKIKITTLSWMLAFKRVQRVFDYHHLHSTRNVSWENNINMQTLLHYTWHFLALRRSEMYGNTEKVLAFSSMINELPSNGVTSRIAFPFPIFLMRLNLFSCISKFHLLLTNLQITSRFLQAWLTRELGFNGYGRSPLSIRTHKQARGLEGTRRHISHSRKHLQREKMILGLSLLSQASKIMEFSPNRTEIQWI